MGGLGSGRYRLSRRETTSAYLRLDIRWLQRTGDLVPGRSTTVEWSENGEPCGAITVVCESNSIVLSYNHKFGADPWKHERYRAGIDWTRCHYGGRRPWFLCPGVGCARRVAVLYCGGIFACRKCHHLTHESQRKPALIRAIRRAQGIREKLGASANMLAPLPAKPKGMHLRTYWRLLLKYERATGVFLASVVAQYPNLLSASSMEKGRRLTQR